MRVSSFCPGHISCVFQPFTSYNPLGTGSRGIGIRLSLGARSTVQPRDDDTVNVWIDDVPSEANVTRMMVRMLAPDRGFDIHIDTDVPVSQGFGMSAAGTLSTAICIADIVGKTRNDAFSAAHDAELLGGGGLGDVSAIVAGRDIPVRTVPGFPPYGKVENARFTIPELTLAVLGPALVTDTVLSDSHRIADIRDASAFAMDDFLAEPTYDKLFEVSNRFSSEANLESPAIRGAMDGLKRRGYHAGMCMLGNSIFTDAPESVLFAMLGRGHVRTYRCSSSPREIQITRRE